MTQETTKAVASRLALAMAAAGVMMPAPRIRDMPPEPKRRNLKRAAQAAQRKARAITRRAGK
jgi:hypothetical protein